MKAHVGTDLQGIVHSLTTTAAHVADITQLPHLLHGDERVLHGDQAYFTKVRYRCLAKNTARLFAAFALANLYLLRRRLAPEVCAA